MKTIFILLITFLSINLCFSQTSDTTKREDSVYLVVDEMPMFPEGLNALSKYLKKHIKYPESAIKNKISGRVFVSFIVEKDGSISNVEVVKGVSKALDNEAVRVIRSMPKWDPGKQNGKPVPIKMQIPINFTL